MAIWFVIVNGQISSVLDRAICMRHDNGGVLSFHVFLFVCFFVVVFFCLFFVVVFFVVVFFFCCCFFRYLQGGRGLELPACFLLHKVPS